MKLIECYIENFGTLSEIRIPFSESCHVMLKENGWGKSTLAAFIRAMFYGFDNERSRDEYQNERKRYRPWQGGVYGGSLVFEVDGREYLVTRTFGMKEKEDTFILRDRKTNRESFDYTKELGEELFSLDLPSFKRTVFLSQNDCMTEPTDRIHSKIGNLAENMDDMNNYEKVYRQLTDRINAMSPDRKTGSLYKKKEQIASLEMNLMGPEYGLLSEEKRKNEERKNSLKRRYDNLKAEQKKISAGRKPDPASLEERMHAEKIYISHIFTKEEKEQYLLLNHLLCEQDIKEKEVLEAYYNEACFAAVREKESPVMKNHRMMEYLVFVLAGALFLFGIVYQITKGLPGIVIALSSVIFLLLGIILKKKRERNTKAGTVILDKMEDLHEQLTEKYRIRQQALEQLRKNEALTDTMGERLDAIFSEMEELIQQIAQADKKQEVFRLKEKELDEKQALIKIWKEEFAEEETKYRRLLLTREYLAKARESFALRYTDRLRKGFSRYYELLTGENTGNYMLDSQMKLTKWEKADQRESRYFSAGYQDLTGFCMRMALIDAMYQEEKPFLVLDDPFVNLDESKLEGAKKLLSYISEEYQVIYLICHESRNVLEEKLAIDTLR